MAGEFRGQDDWLARVLDRARCLHENDGVLGCRHLAFVRVLLVVQTDTEDVRSSDWCQQLIDLSSVARILYLRIQVAHDPCCFARFVKAPIML